MLKNISKIFVVILLLFFTAFISYYALGNKVDNLKQFISKTRVTNRIEHNEIENPSYKLTINYDWVNQKIDCIAEVEISRSFLQDSVLYFQLPVNGLKSKRTYFSLNKNFGKKDFSQFKFNRIEINNRQADYNYLHFVNGFENDSTLLAIKIPDFGDNKITVIFSYSIKLPQGDFLLGYSRKKNFALLKGFYPELLPPGVRKSNFPPFDTFNALSLNFQIKINLPPNVELLNPGFDKKTSGNYSRKVNNVRDLILFFSSKPNNLLSDSLLAGSEKISIFYQSNNSDLLTRIKTAIIHSKEYLNKKFNLPSQKNLLIIDLPRTFKIRRIYSVGVIAIHINLFSPIWNKEPEADLIKGMVYQTYNGNYVADISRNYWLVIGIADFITDEIFTHYYGNISQSFKLVSYLPIKGENMFSYDEIPIIYRINSFEYPIWKEKLSDYLSIKNKVSFLNFGLSLTSTKEFEYISRIKPSLSLRVLRNYFGEEKLNSVLNSFKTISDSLGEMNVANFNLAVRRNLGENGAEIWRNISNSFGNLDYRIDGITRLYGNKYALMLSKSGNIVLPQNIVVYTKNDSLHLFWEGKSEIKEITFTSPDEVIGAEIDCKNRNILDVNKANNSYMLKGNFTTPFSYAIHWFFWVQNALMMFGIFG